MLSGRLNYPIYTLGLIAAFLIGVLSAGTIRDIVFNVRGAIEPQCIRKNVCVGHNIQDALVSLSIDSPIGGLVAVQCGVKGVGGYVGVQKILNGETCDADTYTLLFEDSSQLTFISIDGSSIVEISQVSSRSFDL
jgi:hypothetical protein